MPLSPRQPIAFPDDAQLWGAGAAELGIMAWSAPHALLRFVNGLPSLNSRVPVEIPGPKLDQDGSEHLPDSFWLEARRPAFFEASAGDGANETGTQSLLFRLAWSRRGCALGDVRWRTTSSSAPVDAVSDQGGSSFDASRSAGRLQGIQDIRFQGPHFDVPRQSADGSSSGFKAKAIGGLERLMRSMAFARTLTHGAHMDAVVCIDAATLEETQRCARSEGACMTQALEIRHWQTRILGPDDVSLTDHKRTAHAAQLAHTERNAAAADLHAQAGWARRLFAGLIKA